MRCCASLLAVGSRCPLRVNERGGSILGPFRGPASKQTCRETKRRPFRENKSAVRSYIAPLIDHRSHIAAAQAVCPRFSRCRRYRHFIYPGREAQLLLSWSFPKAINTQSTKRAFEIQHRACLAGQARRGDSSHDSSTAAGCRQARQRSVPVHQQPPSRCQQARQAAPQASSLGPRPARGVCANSLRARVKRRGSGHGRHQGRDRFAGWRASIRAVRAS